MRGKRPSMYDNVSFFFKAAAMLPQVDCQQAAFSPIELLHKSRTACHYHPPFVTLHISLALCYCKGSHTPTCLHINTGLPVRGCTVKLAVCVTTETALVGVLIYLVVEQQKITFYLWQWCYSSFHLLWWTKRPLFHCEIKKYPFSHLCMNRTGRYFEEWIKSSIQP